MEVLEDSISTQVNDDEMELFKTYTLSESEALPENENDVDSKLIILDEIARGGMGVVFKGYQTSLEREVAIKKIIFDDDVVLKNRFLAESKVTAFLDHPNIVPVYELKINKQDDLILVMKLVKGTSWKDILKESVLSVSAPR